VPIDLSLNPPLYVILQYFVEKLKFSNGINILKLGLLPWQLQKQKLIPTKIFIRQNTTKLVENTFRVLTKS